MPDLALGSDASAAVDGSARDAAGADLNGADLSGVGNETAGCGCRIGGTPTGKGELWMAALFLVALLARRRILPVALMIVAMLGAGCAHDLRPTSRGAIRVAGVHRHELAEHLSRLAAAKLGAEHGQCSVLYFEENPRPLPATPTLRPIHHRALPSAPPPAEDVPAQRDPIARGS
jgi:MYXO-CTERM domain-containing protein